MVPPPVTSTTPAEATRAAATERGTRTFAQGIGIDVAVAVAMALLMWLPDADLASRDAWIILASIVGKSVLTAIASYVMRLKVAPSQEAELIDGAYLITDLDTGKGHVTDEAPPAP
jgi:hypothetical protein